MAATDAHATIEELLEALLSVWSVPRSSCDYEVLRRQLQEYELVVRESPASKDVNAEA
jgi:hypothetical protein